MRLSEAALQAQCGLMCPSPTAAAEAPATEAVECAPAPAADAIEASSPQNFSFGTTQPLELPAVLPQTLPCASADSQAQALDDEFTFGTTVPLALPDLTQVPRDYWNKGNSPASASLASVSPRSSPPKVFGSPSVPTSRSSGYELHNASPDRAQFQQANQVFGHWSPEAVSPYLPSQVAMQGFWSGPTVMQSALGYSPSASLVYAEDVWSKPLPIVTLPYEMPAMQNAENYQTQVSGVDTSASVHLDAAKSCDLERGEDEASGDDLPCMHQLDSRPSWGFKFKNASPARRFATALCIFLVFICIAALVAIVCVDMR